MTHRTNTDQFTYLPGRYLCGNQNYGAFPRHRCDASSMAWRCRFLAARRVHLTYRLISTQVGTSPAPSGRDSPCLSGTSGSPRFSHCPALTGRRGPSSTAHRPSGPVWKSNFTPSTRRLLDGVAMPVPHHTGRDAERLEEGLPGELQTRRLRVAVGDKKAERRRDVARPQHYTSGGRSAHAGRVLHRAEEIQGVRAAAAWSPCSLTSMLTLKSQKQN